MKPPVREKTDFERVKVDEWLPGVIEEIEYDMEHKKVWEGKEKVGPAIRFRFKLEGYQFPHRSRWMSFLYGEKSNLYLKYLKHLVEGALPDMDFDLDHLKGFKVKTMWTANGDWDNLEQIRPFNGKFQMTTEPLEPSGEGAGSEDIPF